MANKNDPESDQPHRRPHRVGIQRRSAGMRDETTPKDASRGSLPARDEERPTASLETGEQEAAASRERGCEEPQNELHEIGRAGRALQTSTPRRLNGDSGREQDNAVPDSPLESPRPHVSDFQSTEPKEVNNSQSDGERNEADSPDAAVSGVRWMSQQDLEKLISQGVLVFQSEKTEAIYCLNNRGEKVWVVDKNKDCVIGQPKRAGSTPESSPEGADG